jgi:hypothetical protein
MVTTQTTAEQAVLQQRADADADVGMKDLTCSGRSACVIVRQCQPGGVALGADDLGNRPSRPTDVRVRRHRFAGCGLMLRNLKQFVRVLMAPAFSPEALESDQGQCASLLRDRAAAGGDTTSGSRGLSGGRQTSASC